MHIALGGCLRPPPVAYGLTEDTGGHIAYILGAALAQIARPDISAVEIVTRAFDDPKLGTCHALPREQVVSGCDIVRLRTARSDYLAKEDLEAEIPALTVAFLSLLDGMERRPDILHAHFGDAAVLARAASEKFGIPWLYSSHSLALDKAGCGTPGPGAARRIDRERLAVCEADAIVASSRDEAERQLPAYDYGAEGRIHHVGPGVMTPRKGDRAKTRRLLEPFLRDPSKPVILAIARPIGKKNLAGLMRAYAKSRRLREKANLVIVAGLREGLTGSGTEPDRVVSDLFDLVDRNDLWGRVALPRWHDAEDVTNLYALAAADGVFVNPAWHEPFGLTIIEAAQADVPVVATCNGGPSDILRTLGYGELVHPDDEAEMSAAILRVLEDPTRMARARAAGRIARQQYDWTGWANRVTTICHGLLEKRPRVASIRRELVACDIDGTLTGSRAGAARFGDWRSQTIGDTLFCVATGRSVVDARRVLADWSLPDPDVFITSVGSEIWRWSSRGLELCNNYAAIISEGWDRGSIEAALQPLGLRPQPAYDQRRWKLSYYCGAVDARQVRETLFDAGLPARVIHSHGRLLDILPARAGKAAAVRFEAGRLGLALGDCIVAGDSGNDRDMLEEFRRAILPANAATELDDLADVYRSERDHADGVLDGLAMLTREPPGFLMAAE